jgi:nuclear transport factor 2 (NTF2) superfamily protein
VRKAKDGRNSRNPVAVPLADTPDTIWRNRAEFPVGRAQVVEFLTRKWAKELEYRLIKELWAFTENRIAVRFTHEWHDDSGQWYRSYGNENWEFAENGLKHRPTPALTTCRSRPPTANATSGPKAGRPDDHPGLSDLGL